MAGLLSGNLDPSALDFTGQLLSGYGQQAGFAPALGRALQAGGAASYNAQQRAAAEQDYRLKQARMEQGLLEYQAATMQAAAEQAEKLRKERAGAKEKAELRSLVPEGLQDLYDVDPERALSMTPQFADPSKRYVTVGNQVIDRLAEGAPAMAYEVPETISPAEQEKLKISRERLDLDRGIAAGGGAETTAALRTRRAKIDDARRLQGLSEPEATALVDNQFSIVTDPTTGKSLMVNRATGGAEPIGPPRQPIPLIGGGQDSQPVSVEEMAGEVGVVPALADIRDRTLGQLVPGIVSGERVRAGQALNNVRQKAIAAFSLSSRPPVIEQERIESMLPKAQMLESPPRARAALDELGRTAITTRDQYAALINSGRLPVDQENELLLKITELDRLSTSLGALPSEGRPEAVTEAQPAPQANAAPPGGQPQAAAPQARQEAPQQAFQRRAQSMGLAWSDVEQTAREEGVTVQEVLDQLQRAGVGAGG